MGTIHASFSAFKDVKSKVLASRGSSIAVDFQI